MMVLLLFESLKSDLGDVLPIVLYREPKWTKAEESLKFCTAVAVVLTVKLPASEG